MQLHRAWRSGPAALAGRERPIRLAILCYLGHMWELYASWACAGVIAAASFTASGLGDGAAETAGTSIGAHTAATLTAFAAIALRGLAYVPAGWLADRCGQARVAIGCSCLGGGAGLAAAVPFGGPPWAMVRVLILWGIAIIPDSALYSTMVADAAPPERAGTLMTLQTALGFLLTALTAQALPRVASLAGWPIAIALLAIGPAIGIKAPLAFLRPPST